MNRLLKKLLLKLFERPMPDMTDADRVYAEELRSDILTQELTLSEVPSDSERSWFQFNENLRSCVRDGDPREFLLWDVIRQTMFVSNPSYVAKEYRYLRKLPEWKDRWKPAVEETPIGRPRPYPRYPRSSGNLLHHAYHVSRFEAASGIKIHAVDQVFEFGGGYGSMARLFFQLGYTGEYLIYDFPYFSSLQRFFLRSSGFSVNADRSCRDRDVSNAGKGVACCVSELDHLRQALQQTPPEGTRMFLGTWSISEAPIGLRGQILSLVKDFDYFLIAFQHRFEEIDNSTYFRTWAESLSEGYCWQWHPIEHLSGSSYLFGWRT